MYRSKTNHHTITIHSPVAPRRQAGGHRFTREGAEDALPISREMFIEAMCFSKSSLETCFMRMSSGFAEPAILANDKSPLFNRSCIHRSDTCKYLILLKPRRQQMPIAAVASVNIWILNEMPRSFAIDCSPKAIDAPRQIPLSSASPEDNAIVVCVSD